MARNSDFGAADRELRASWLVALAGSAARVVSVAARDSRIVMSITGVMRDFRALPAVARLRAVTLTVAVAVATHLLLERLVPLRVAPTIPPIVWVAVGLVNAAIAAAARPSQR